MIQYNEDGTRKVRKGNKKPMKKGGKKGLPPALKKIIAKKKGKK